MKVSDFMRKSLVTVSEDDCIEKVIKIIFNLGIKSVPVVRKKKLIALITEQDVLTKLFPTMRDFIEDRERALNFEGMESNLRDLLNKPVKDIMNRDIFTITPDSPLMIAQSNIILKKFSHIPIVDSKKNLVGIITQGDIFRAIVGQEIPYDDNEEYHAWLSRHWDLVNPWKRRLEAEITDINSVFQKYNVFRVVDILCGTGEHDIALAREGYDVVGLNEYMLMHHAAIKKHASLPDYIKNRVTFKHGNYINVLNNIKGDFDAAIFMGNAIAHNPQDYKKILTAVSNSLVKKNAVIILQIANFYKILNVSEGLQEFNIRESKIANTVKYAFIQYYDPPSKTSENLTLNMNILRHDGHRWHYVGLNSTKIAHITQEKITGLLKQLKFKNISIYGGYSHQPLFSEAFIPEKHDCINIVAVR